VTWRLGRLLLLTIPFPGLVLNQGVVKFGDLLFNIRIGTLRIFSIITFISFVVLVGASCCGGEDGVDTRTLEPDPG
jgi:hypothetical protein